MEAEEFGLISFYRAPEQQSLAGIPLISCSSWNAFIGQQWSKHGESKIPKFLPEVLGGFGEIPFWFLENQMRLILVKFPLLWRRGAAKNVRKGGLN